MPLEGPLVCSGGYILIIDDDATIQASLQEILSVDFGHNVRTASNGREALGVLEGSEPPALILVDLMMPQMDGVALIERVNRQAGLAHVPFCVMTASGRWEPPLSLLTSVVGKFSVLRKPFDLQDLVSIVERYC